MRGEAYRKGTGVARDPAAAIRWMEKSAEGGAPLAARRLSLMYAMGEGVPRSPSKSEEWAQRALELSQGRADLSPKEAAQAAVWTWSGPAARWSTFVMNDVTWLNDLGRAVPSEGNGKLVCTHAAACARSTEPRGKPVVLTTLFTLRADDCVEVSVRASQIPENPPPKPPSHDNRKEVWNRWSANPQLLIPEWYANGPAPATEQPGRALVGHAVGLALGRQRFDGEVEKVAAGVASTDASGRATLCLPAIAASYQAKDFDTSQRAQNFDGPLAWKLVIFPKQKEQWANDCDDLLDCDVIPLDPGKVREESQQESGYRPVMARLPIPFPVTVRLEALWKARTMKRLDAKAVNEFLESYWPLPVARRVLTEAEAARAQAQRREAAYRKDLVAALATETNRDDPRALSEAWSSAKALPGTDGQAARRAAVDLFPKARQQAIAAVDRKAWNHAGTYLQLFDSWKVDPGLPAGAEETIAPLRTALQAWRAEERRKSDARERKFRACDDLFPALKARERAPTAAEKVWLKEHDEFVAACFVQRVVPIALMPGPAEGEMRQCAYEARGAFARACANAQ